jgi:hypothetical protein
VTPEAALVAELRDWLRDYADVPTEWLERWSETPGLAVTYAERIPPALEHLQPRDAAFILRCRQIEAGGAL